jgi:CRP/FNR family nitrogen fixation transcriptional regulator
VAAAAGRFHDPDQPASVESLTEHSEYRRGAVAIILRPSQRAEERGEAMYVQFASNGYGDARDSSGSGGGMAHSGTLDTLIALERIGTRRLYARNDEIFAEGDPADCWFRVISGAVRVCKLMADGRRHIAEFHFPGDCFGFDSLPDRLFSAEAVSSAVIMRFPRRATERLIDDNPDLARWLREMALRDLANAQIHMLMLGRMSAPERVATFLLDMAERRDAGRALDLPMSRGDIADYLGLTIETVCRVLSAFKRDGIIDIPNAHRIELRDREALAAIGEG